MRFATIGLIIRTVSILTALPILSYYLVFDAYRLFAEDSPKSEEDSKPEVVKVDTNKPPIVLQSVEAKKTNAPPRIPVYVLPEVIEVRIPGGMRFIFVEQHHMQELAKKFPAIRYTNIIIYNDGL